MPQESDRLLEYEKRFGNVAIEKGFITKYQLGEALINQVAEEIENSKHRLIGHILFDLNYITNEQIQKVLGALIQD